MSAHVGVLPDTTALRIANDAGRDAASLFRSLCASISQSTALTKAEKLINYQSPSDYMEAAAQAFNIEMQPTLTAQVVLDVEPQQIRIFAGSTENHSPPLNFHPHRNDSIIALEEVRHFYCRQNEAVIADPLNSSLTF